MRLERNTRESKVFLLTVFSEILVLALVDLKGDKNNFINTLLHRVKKARISQKASFHL